MTFSILAIEPEQGGIGGAAATGSLCVGGWVLRGSLSAGMSASQGASPSTFWGEQVLDAMQAGQSAADAVTAVTENDSGKPFRQLAALSLDGQSSAYTGEQNTDVKGSLKFAGGIAAGNLLASQGVLNALIDGFRPKSIPFAERLLRALRSAESAGGDTRGLQSAALLVLYPHQPPLNLRIDYSESPIADLTVLLKRASSGDYADWLRQVPTMTAPQRGLIDEKT